MSPLSVPNFSLIGVHVCILWQILQSVRKEKVEEKNPKLWLFVSQKWLGKVSSHFICRLIFHVVTSVPTLVPMG